MPGKPDKQHRIRVRAADGKPREWNKLKAQLGAHLDVIDAKGKVEFIVCGVNEKQIEQVRSRLGGAGLDPVDGGDTTITAAAPKQAPVPQRGGPASRGGHPHRGGSRPAAAPTNAPDLRKKPYGFVALPKDLTPPAAPVWHDGSSSKGRLSGEIRLELETLTPLLVGWERQPIVPKEGEEPEWPIEHKPDGDYVSMNLSGRWSAPITPKKSVLCPLRAPWGKRPVIIPGDSLKGLLRHELGALLGAPMERVAERSYSYRPNAMYPLKPENRFLVPRLARVMQDHVETKLLDGEHQVRVPTRLELFPATLEYNKKANKLDYRFDQQGGAPYRGGQGAGQKLNSKPKVHTSLKVLQEVSVETFDVPKMTQDGYLATVRHLVDLADGHFSERHPDVPKRQGKPESVDGEEARKCILKAAKDEVFQPGDLVWVEWDTEKKCIVSLGWHYYYRWAYTDSVRKTGGKLERHGLFPLDKEREKDSDGAPTGLTAVRRLFGYAFDKENPGTAGIGQDDYTQLMGRVFVNSALEVVGDNDGSDNRFLKPAFLKELGMPRPSAVEHYLKQNLDAQGRAQKRPSDNATLVTYGDAAGYDTPGELAGRKFYLDRPNAVAEDASDTNRQNDRSTLALEASKPGRKFRFTVRFRDLDAAELAAILIALSPDQFKSVLGGTHGIGYCSKLGYARPLGWGSVRIEAQALLLLDAAGDAPTLKPEADVADWVKTNHKPTTTQKEWLDIHCRNHPNAADYPRPQQADRNGERNIYTFHTTLRAEHSRNRRYKNGRSP